MHHTPTYASRFSQVERSFGLTTYQAIRRESFRSEGVDPEDRRPRHQAQSASSSVRVEP
jgi:hypothetical protein